ncbi:MAG TPA: DNA polymerase I [Candidatus Latescibacteria bacterium]|nr:DNA polymerase I [Candidatus Latescibacterota bacterium]
MSPKRLFLIDGYSLLYRSYYAIPGLSNSGGFPTGAIYGFLNALRKIVDKEKPDYLGVVFDVKGPTVRHEAFGAYKAHRKPMPEDLVAQLPVLKDVLGALRIATAEYPKYEADDALASLAARAAAKGILTVIVTTDKDLLQVVDATTSIWNPSKETTIDAAGVKDVFGVGAGEVVDVLSLWGDPTDNVPGVPGIGEKTAKSLIQEFGSLDNLLRNIDRVKNPRVRERIIQNRELLELSRRLVTVTRDLDLELDLARYAVQEPDEKETIRLFQELEFSSLLADFLKKPRLRAAKEFHTIFEEDKLRALAARIAAAGEVALDTETDSASPTRARLVGLSFSLLPGEAFYVPVGHDYLGAPPQIPKERALDILRSVLEDPAVRKIGQNIKYDLIVLEREGVRLAGVSKDTMVLSYLLEPNWGRHGLEKLALHYLQETKAPYEDIVGRGKNELTMDKVEIERAAPYACQDAALALELGSVLWEKIEAKSLDRLYEDIERPLIGLLARMEIWGVRVDTEVLKSMSKELGGELGRLEKEIHALAGGAFNINSPRQLGDILFHKLGLPSSRRTKITKGYSTSLDILEELAAVHPLARYVLDYRQMAKLKSTYADALPQLINPATGRIHTSYNQTVASTGRLSSSEPNLQNIPARGPWGARFRRAFIPDKGHFLLAADYSQIELRVLAHLSQDPKLIATFLEDRDVHEETARLVFGENAGEETRRRAKIINFSIVYGTSAFSLAKELGTSVAEAQKFIDRYFGELPGVKAYLDKVVEEARERGYSETIFGRKRQVPELRMPDRNLQQAGRRIALNNPIQGSAADLIKEAMLRAAREIEARGLRTRMILQVHDELVFEVPERERSEVEPLVRTAMEGAAELLVPLKVRLGCGPNWADAK